MLAHSWTPLIRMWFNRGVTCPSVFTLLVIELHRIGREVCSNTIFVTTLIIDFLMDHVRQFTRWHFIQFLFGQKPSVSLLQDLNIQLFFRSMIVPTKKHKIVEHVYLHSHIFWKTLEKLSHNYSKSNMFNGQIFKQRVTEKYMYLVDISNIN